MGNAAEYLNQGNDYNSLIKYIDQEKLSDDPPFFPVLENLQDVLADIGYPDPAIPNERVELYDWNPVAFSVITLHSENQSKTIKVGGTLSPADVVNLTGFKKLTEQGSIHAIEVEAYSYIYKGNGNGVIRDATEWEMNQIISDGFPYCHSETVLRESDDHEDPSRFRLTRKEDGWLMESTDIMKPRLLVPKRITGIDRIDKDTFWSLIEQAKDISGNHRDRMFDIINEHLTQLGSEEAYLSDYRVVRLIMIWITPARKSSLK